MMTFDEIRATAQDGARYWAIGENGRKYSATYSADFGGVMFFCIPAEIAVIGYEKRDIKTFIAHTDGNYTGADLMREYAVKNGYKIENTMLFKTVITIDGKQYEYDRIAKSKDSDSVTVTLAEVA